MIPGVTTRKPRVKFRRPGRRTAFTVCQAISMAMTVVLPAPVAILRAIRRSSGFAMAFASWRWFQMPRNRGGRFVPESRSAPATSTSQIAVSAASIWQKKGRRFENW